MSVEAVLAKRQSEMSGRTINHQEADDLTKAISPSLLPGWLVNWLLTYPLVETDFSLSASDDNSELGVEMKWLSPPQIISETVEAFPGIAAAGSGYLPIGMCLEGSGDYYFLKTTAGDDPPFVRIPHDAVDAERRLRDDQVEIVAPSLSEFIEKAGIN
jgi:hypothetical protein